MHSAISMRARRGSTEIWGMEWSLFSNSLAYVEFFVALFSKEVFMVVVVWSTKRTKRKRTMWEIALVIISVMMFDYNFVVCSFICCEFVVTSL